MCIEVFEVGGCVRDEIMGRPFNDIDYTVIAPSYMAMKEFVLMHDMQIVVENPEFYTLRAVAKNPFRGRRGGLDFVWARKEGTYSDGRRPDHVTPGTLNDDLRRRDFCLNAIAKDSESNYIDPFNGRADIASRIIRAVGDPFKRLSEDALRAVRALRFSVTLKFSIELKLAFAMETKAVLDSIKYNISDERIKDELAKMFKFDTVASLRALQKYPLLTQAMLSDSVWLMPTMKER